MSTWRLIEFPQSHYCEVARWAMDHKQIAFVSDCPLPVWHAVVAKRRGCDATTLPILEGIGVVVQGSAAIVDYFEQTVPEPSLMPDATAEEVAAIEAEMSDRLAVPLRQLAYCHLLRQPDVIRYLFMHRSGPFERAVFPLLYPMLSRKLRAGYNCSPEGQAEAEEELAQAFSHYDAMLAGKRYFLDDRFTRIDMTFAAMLAPAVLPAEHPVPWPEKLRASQLSQWFAQFAEGASLQHVLRVYREHR
jgi:glutathione S-transferase